MNVVQRSLRTLTRQEPERIRALTERCRLLEKEREKLVLEIKEALAREQTLKCELADTARKLQLQLEANLETRHIFEQHLYDACLSKRLVNSQQQQFDVFEESFHENYFLKEEMNDALKALGHLQKSECHLEELVENLHLDKQARTMEIEELKVLLERSNFELDEQKRSHSFIMKEMRLERDIIAMKLKETACQLEELYQQQNTWLLNVQGVASMDDNLVAQLKAEADIWRHLYEDIHDKICLPSPGTSYKGVRAYCNRKRDSANFLLQIDTHEEHNNRDLIQNTDLSSDDQDKLTHRTGSFPSVNW